MDSMSENDGQKTYEEKYKQWREDYTLVYNYYKKIHSSSLEGIENLLITLPGVGIVAYIFDKLLDENISLIKLMMVLFVAAAPLMALGIAYILTMIGAPNIINHMEKQLETKEQLVPPSSISIFHKKISIMQKLVWFPPASAVCSIIMAVLVRLDKMDCLICMSTILFVAYAILGGCFICMLNQPVKSEN